MANVRPTKKQRELLSFIEEFIAAHGYSPSFREIMDALNYKSVSTVAIHINNLIARGHLRKRDNSARSLEIISSSVAEPTFAVAAVTPAEEKWLVEQIARHFAAVEAKPPQAGEVDQLYVLVGALHILGFDEAAMAYKSRLNKLTQG